MYVLKNKIWLQKVDLVPKFYLREHIIIIRRSSVRNVLIWWTKRIKSSTRRYSASEIRTQHSKIIRIGPYPHYWYITIRGGGEVSENGKGAVRKYPDSLLTDDHLKSNSGWSISCMANSRVFIKHFQLCTKQMRVQWALVMFRITRFCWFIRYTLQKFKCFHQFSLSIKRLFTTRYYSYWWWKTNVRVSILWKLFYSEQSKSTLGEAEGFQGLWNLPAIDFYFPKMDQIAYRLHHPLRPADLDLFDRLTGEISNLYYCTWKNRTNQKLVHEYKDEVAVCGNIENDLTCCPNTFVENVARLTWNHQIYFQLFGSLCHYSEQDWTAILIVVLSAAINLCMLEPWYRYHLPETSRLHWNWRSHL